MLKQVQQANDEWERRAIEKCAADPKFMKLGLCPVCIVDPCICGKKDQERVGWLTRLRHWWRS